MSPLSWKILGNNSHQNHPFPKCPADNRDKRTTHGSQIRIVISKLRSIKRPQITVCEWIYRLKIIPLIVMDSLLHNPQEETLESLSLKSHQIFIRKQIPSPILISWLLQHKFTCHFLSAPYNHSFPCLSAATIDSLQLPSDVIDLQHTKRRKSSSFRNQVWNPPTQSPGASPSQVTTWGSLGLCVSQGPPTQMSVSLSRVAEIIKQLATLLAATVAGRASQFVVHCPQGRRDPWQFKVQSPAKDLHPQIPVNWNGKFGRRNRFLWFYKILFSSDQRRRETTRSRKRKSPNLNPSVRPGISL